jgi:putative membrane protein insertion efficiency factor
VTFPRRVAARIGRTLARWVGLPARAALIGGIMLYRATLAGLLGGQCRFHPSCSHYAEAAIRARGALVGSAFALWRIARCQPYGRGGLDPAPGPIRVAGGELPAEPVPEYDIVIRQVEGAA